jgi:hypothetical protein
MKNQKSNPLFAFCLRTVVLAIAAITLANAHADPVLWSGPTTNFVQNPVDFINPPEADVIIPGAVSLTRNGNHWLYNTNVDLGADVGTPSDTEWSFGTADSLHTVTNLTYKTFDLFRTGNLSLAITNKAMVCHLINEDIYFAVKFVSWPQGGGAFRYQRSTPSAVAPPPPKPTVGITSPATNAVFAAPANVSITANATVSTGSVTNVQFFVGVNSIGSKQPPAQFSTTANGLGAGSYVLTAVATAAGISTTSAPVNISVVTPVSTSVSGPAATVDNNFTFAFSSTPGLRYEVDVSSNLFDWTPVATNVATGGQSFFTNPISGDGNYYRVGRLPNP